MGMYLSAKQSISLPHMVKACKANNLPEPTVHEEEYYASIDEETFDCWAEKAAAIMEDLQNGFAVKGHVVQFLLCWTVIAEARMNDMCKSDEYDPPWENLIFT
jgi:hypothetical protein